MPTPPAPAVTATASWNTTTGADGNQPIVATATDRAGTSATVSRTVIVDNTPPDTQITAGPSGTMAETSATVTFTGTDNLTAIGSLQFAWRLDGGVFSAFSAATTATLTGLTEGSHTFEVKARDLAGNEDPTPASQTFTVAFGPTIASVDPATGTIGTLVTITGANFQPGPTQVAFNGLAAVVRTITATTLTTTVPIGATTGNLTLTTPRGSASRPFTVTTTGDFTLTASPAAVRAIAGDQAALDVQVAGSGSFTNLVSLSVSAGPAGVSTSVGAALVAPGRQTFLAFTVGNGVAPGIYAFTITGEASVDGRTLTRTANATLEVLAPGTAAVTGRV
ncbi:MAG: IPT/TIG domain-containing protein, partial [Nocardioidaceae bacterium]